MNEEGMGRGRKKVFVVPSFPPRPRFSQTEGKKDAARSLIPQNFVESCLTPPSCMLSHVSGRSIGSGSNGRTLEQAEAEAAVTVASSDSRVVPRPPISLMDLRDALQVSYIGTDAFVVSFKTRLRRFERTTHNRCHARERHSTDTKRGSNAQPVRWL